MNGQLILREWKEKISVPLFALGFLVVFVVLAFVLAERGDALDLLTGTILLVFLPMTAVLLGAGAFGSETRDGAWAYLFSRPLKKSTIWISKLVALAGYLAAVLLVYGIALTLVPGIRERIADKVILAGELPGPVSFLMVGVVLSVGLFVIAFSLSILSEKQLQVVFLTGFAFAGLSLAVGAALGGLIEFRPTLWFLAPTAWALGSAAVGAASLRAFCRADFSQPRAKTIHFLKSLGASLAAAALLVLAVVWASRWFGRTSYLWVTDVQGSSAFLESSRGTFRYDAERNELTRLRRNKYEFWGGNAAGNGGKVVWIEESLVKIRGGRDLKQDIWIMDGDGRNKRPLFQASESRNLVLDGLRIYDCQISRDGSQVFFLTLDYGQNSREAVCWTVNADGSGLRAHRTEIPNVEWIHFCGWSADGSHVILHVIEKTRPGDKRWLKRRSRLYRLTLASDAWQAFPEDASGVYVFGLSPDGTRLGLLVSGSPEADAPQDTLALFDVETMTRTDLLRIPGIQLLRWNPDGERVAFLAGNGARIGIVSLTEKRVLSERALSTSGRERMRGTMDWAAGGRKVVLSDLEGSRYVLRAFDDAFREEKPFPLPHSETINHFLPVYGLGPKALVVDGINDRAWVFDLSAEKWKKLF